MESPRFLEDADLSKYATLYLTNFDRLSPDELANLIAFLESLK